MVGVEHAHNRRSKEADRPEKKTILQGVLTVRRQERDILPAMQEMSKQRSPFEEQGTRRQKVGFTYQSAQTLCSAALGRRNRLNTPRGLSLPSGAVVQWLRRRSHTAQIMGSTPICPTFPWVRHLTFFHTEGIHVDLPPLTPPSHVNVRPRTRFFSLLADETSKWCSNFSPERNCLEASPNASACRRRSQLAD